MKQVIRYPRLIVSIAFTIVLGLVLRQFIAQSTSLVVALDGGGALFLILTAVMLARTNHERMMRRAQEIDEGQLGMAIVAFAAAALALAAIFLETRNAKNLPPAILHWHLGLAMGSIVLAWLVTHTMFGLHYAHLFYGGDDDPDDGKDTHRGGLEFPGEDKPDYWDFLYFAFVVGMTCQTSDVQVTGRVTRRLTLFQGVLAFFFNTVVLAIAINIAASLL
ncbi:MAG TPA: DUF1345 domain-containing protein [Magnetospirillaceae bacterium]